MTLIAREDQRGEARMDSRGNVRSPTHPESLLGAISEVFAAGQQLVLDRIAMLQAELTSDVQKMAVGGGLIAGAGVVSLLGYVAVSAGLVALLHRWLPLDAALGIVGLFNLILGAIALKLGMNRLSQPSRFDERVAAPEIPHV
ncbi:MAG: phage holin family protein [Deltaproteobacteria bacterium]|nr:phage holin family protein [Deltaproteobacteria bacterium]